MCFLFVCYNEKDILEGVNLDMQVEIKDFSISMELGSKGIELQVKDTSGEHLGDLRIGKATIEWCEGRKRVGNGIKKSWEELIEFFKNS